MAQLASNGFTYAKGHKSNETEYERQQIQFTSNQKLRSFGKQSNATPEADLRPQEIISAK